ncbi:MAG TPA: hypothetical protein VKZ41_02320 [Gemmatimonadales bacterium]|nr:hypothetical protein [Gemmatimonadales bacterium]
MSLLNSIASTANPELPVPWKLIILVFLAAMFVVALGPLAIYVVGALLVVVILGLTITLTITGLYSARQAAKASGDGPKAGSGNQHIVTPSQSEAHSSPP